MFYVLTCITQDHDPLLVVLAVAIWLAGASSLFVLLRRARDSARRRARHWRALAALTAGVAVWGTHFVAMLGYRAQVPFALAADLTVLSAAIAIGMFHLAITLHDRLEGGAGAAVGGTLLAAGIAAMHFTGMAAIGAPALVLYDLPPILAGQVAATLAAIAAFAALDRMTGARGLLASVGLSLLAVGTLHFTAMAATALVPDATIPVAPLALNHDMLVLAVVCATLVLAALAAVTAVVDRYLTDMRGLSDATQDGIVILRHGTVAEANARFAALVGLRREDLPGRPVADLLPGLADPRWRDDAAGPVEYLLTRADGGTCPVEVTRSRVEYRGRDCDILSLHDLTAAKESQRQILFLAHHDPLTGLANRAALAAFLAQALPAAQGGGGRVAMIALDLDAFKSVNDVFGHHEGDRVLQEVARHLTRLIGPGDLACRIGGDEFIVLRTIAATAGEACDLARRIVAGFDADLRGDRRLRHVGTSVGIALFPDHAQDAEALRHAADLALYRAKETGRGTIQIYDGAMDSRQRRRHEIERDLATAIADGQMWLAYQPVFDSADRHLCGYEALLRWDHPRLGRIGPDEFIPVAEQSGLIQPIGEWVLDRACRDARDWPEEMRVAVNVSAMQFWSPRIVDIVTEALSRHAIAPARLEIELTEGILLRSNDNLGPAIDRLRALGVSIVMDDFGTGFSVIADLQHYVFDKIKIDRSFVAGVDSDPAKQAIIRAIVGLARAMRLPVVAEGVETEAQLTMVALAGCAQVQGFLLGEPAAAPSFAPNFTHGGLARA